MVGVRDLRHLLHVMFGTSITTVESRLAVDMYVPVYLRAFPEGDWSCSCKLYTCVNDKYELYSALINLILLCLLF